MIDHNQLLLDAQAQAQAQAVARYKAQGYSVLSAIGGGGGGIVGANIYLSEVEKMEIDFGNYLTGWDK